MRRTRQVTVLISAVVACALVAGVWLIVQSGRATAAAQSASGFEAAAESSAAPVAVTVISDDFAAPALSGTPVEEWPSLVQTAVDAPVVSLSTAGSGYTTRPLTAQFGGTFRARAAEVARTSKVVVIAGGSNDQRASTSALLNAAIETISNAHFAAPDAQIVVIGPMSTSADPSDQLLHVRDTVRTAATLSHVRFVDPLAQHWLSGVKGAVAADGQSLSEKGERSVATHVEDVVEPLLAR